MKKYQNKIDKRELKSSDIESLINDINSIIKEKRNGHTELSDDDIKQLKVIRFLLNKYEENTSNISLTTRDEQLSHYKTKDIINELELNNIITQVVQGLGGHFNFQITDRIRYLNYLYKLIEELIKKIPSSNFSLKFKIDWKNPYVVGFIVTVGGGLLILIIWVLLTNPFSLLLKEPPRIEIESASFNPTYFGCDNNHVFDIKYKVAHIGGSEVGFGQPYYVFVNQTKNTCLDNFTFFNSTRVIHPLCYNTFYKGKDEVEACNPKFEPINRETILVESHQNSLSYRMTDIFNENNVTGCEITEQIKLCVDLDGNEYCSIPKDVNLKYNCNR